MISVQVKSHTKTVCVLGGSIRCEKAIFGNKLPPLGRRMVVSCCQAAQGSRSKWKVCKIHGQTSAPVTSISSQRLLMQIARYIVRREKMFRVRALQHGYR